MVTTRDQAVMIIDKDEASLWYAPVPSNYPAVTYLSPLVLDRRLVIAAGIDGTLAACEAQTGELVWQHNGPGLAAGPLQRGDRIHAVRDNGELMTVSIEEGDLLATRSLGAGVVAAWQESGVIAGYTATKFWR